jgi:hypothetical protein
VLGARQRRLSTRLGRRRHADRDPGQHENDKEYSSQRPLPCPQVQQPESSYLGACAGSRISSIKRR